MNLDNLCIAIDNREGFLEEVAWQDILLWCKEDVKQQVVTIIMIL